MVRASSARRHVAGNVACVDWLSIVNVICNTASLIALAWIGSNLQRSDNRANR
jgi:hypothetical protein